MQSGMQSGMHNITDFMGRGILRLATSLHLNAMGTTTASVHTITPRVDEQFPASVDLR